MKSKTPLLEKKASSRSQIKVPPQNPPQKTVHPKIALNSAKENKMMEPSQQSSMKNTKQTVNMLKPLVFKVAESQKLEVKNTSKPTKVRPPMMQEANQQLFPCKQCGRSFIQTSLKRHELICKKIFTKKRKEFNSAKQRIISKQQLNLSKISRLKESKKQSKVLIPKWKQQSIAFRIAMKKAKGKAPTTQELNFLAKEKKIVKSTMFKCKFCSRTFNEESGKRHEQHCQLKAKDMANKNKKK